MKIFYDGEIYAMYSQQPSGISRYFANLISRLPEDFSPILTTGQVRDGIHPKHPNLNINRFNLNFPPPRLCRFFKKNYFQFVYNICQPQIAHPTYYSLLTALPISRYSCPVVITVHDMIYEIFANDMDPKGEMTEIKRKAIFSAQAILCNSENTKRDLLERYPSLEDRVTVTLLATELNENYICDQDPIPLRPYFLHVGDRRDYKNFDRLLIAFAKIITKFPDLLLCVVGSPLSSKEHQRIAELGLIQNIEHYCAVSDGQLAKLYNKSIALVYPSLYEGFGIPLLEAMSCGTAVIASDRSSIPEVVEDAGLLFDPTSTDELVDRLLFLLENPSDRNLLIEKGKLQTKKFSWEKTTLQTVNVYQSLL